MSPRKKEAHEPEDTSLTLIDEAYHQLKEMIFRRNMIAGQRLVGKDLADMLGMSRTPIINALYLLEREGFVQSHPFRGFYVKPIDIQETKDLFEVREALETMAAQLAIERLQPGDMEPLEEAARKHAAYMPAAYDRQKIALGVEFHLQIARIARNQRLLHLLTINMQHEYLRYVLDQADLARMKPARQEHTDIIDAIKRRDEKKVVDLIRRHVRYNRDHVIHFQEKQQKANEELLTGRRRRNVRGSAKENRKVASTGRKRKEQ